MKKHGESGSAEFRAWCGMMARGGAWKDKHPRNHRSYSDRGISIHERYLVFVNFLADLGRKPSPKHTLDRIDNNRGYEPGNIRWATREQQQQNISINVNLTANGKTQCALAWSRELSIPKSAIYKRKADGWTDAEALGIVKRKRKWSTARRERMMIKKLANAIQEG